MAAISLATFSPPTGQRFDGRALVDDRGGVGVAAGVAAAAAARAGQGLAHLGDALVDLDGELLAGEGEARAKEHAHAPEDARGQEDIR